MKVLQNRCRSEGELELPERGISCWGPGEADAFACERGEGGREGAVVEDEILVEVSKP